MTPTPYTLKSSALAALRRRYAEQRGQVSAIEPRLQDYFDGLVTVEPNADADPQDHGEVVWMQTCFAVEDETGHHTPICQLRAKYSITVTGNKFEGM